MVTYAILKEFSPTLLTVCEWPDVPAAACAGLVKISSEPYSVTAQMNVSTHDLQTWAEKYSFKHLRQSSSEVKVQESKPKAPNPGLQTQELTPRNPGPALQTQQPTPRNPSSGLQI